MSTHHEDVPGVVFAFFSTSINGIPVIHTFIPFLQELKRSTFQFTETKIKYNPYLILSI